MGEVSGAVPFPAGHEDCLQLLAIASTSRYPDSVPHTTEKGTPMPTFPSIDLTNLDIANLDVTRLDWASLAESARSTARDAAFVMIGAGVLAVREVQIRGRALVDSVVSRTSR